MWWNRLSEVQTEHQKGDLSVLNVEWLFVPDDLGLGISKNCWSTGISRTTICRVYREWSKKEKISSEQQLCGCKGLVDVRGQRRMSRLVRDDRKAKFTQINHSLQPRYADYHLWTHNTLKTLKQMAPAAEDPNRVPFLSAKNKKQRLQFTQAHQNWTTERLEKRFLVWWVWISAATFRW